MGEQRHLIHRQLIEVHVRDERQAHAVQQELAQLFRSRVLSLLNQRFDEHTLSNEHLRIDTLVLDLGRLDPSRLEQDLLARLDDALKQFLPQTRQTTPESEPESSPSPPSSLELLLFFARTGELPWWADPGEASLLERVVGDLLHASPLRQAALTELFRDPISRMRLIRHLSDASLGTLCALLSSTAAKAMMESVSRLLFLLQKTVDEPSTMRAQLWDLLLDEAARQPGQPAAVVYRAALVRGEQVFGWSHLDLAKELQEAQATKAPPEASSPPSLLTPETTSDPIPEPESSSASPPSSLELLLFFARTGELPWWADPGEASLDAAVEELLQANPLQLTTALVELLREPTPRIRLIRHLSRERLSAIKALLMQVGGDTALAVPLLSEPSFRVPLTTMLAKPKIDRANAFKASDPSLPVLNAGLVLLWPFLSHFFDHLGLLNAERRFHDLPGAMRAAGLLQYLVTGEEALVEYLLPLNKRLCGLGPDSIFILEPPLRADELEECENLLLAVIAHASVLNHMSIGGFRGSFLLRPGVLSSRDGMDLLRVERQTYDVVLDRFPWGWAWISLPWMNSPLRVEW